MGNHDQSFRDVYPPRFTLCTSRKPTTPDTTGFHHFEIVMVCRNCATLFLTKTCYVDHLMYHPDCDHTCYWSFEVLCRQNECNTIWWTVGGSANHYEDYGYNAVDDCIPAIFCHFCHIIFLYFTSETYNHFSDHLDDRDFLLERFAGSPKFGVTTLNPTNIPHFPEFLVIYPRGSRYHRELVRMGHAAPPLPESDTESEALSYESISSDSGFSREGESNDD